MKLSDTQLLILSSASQRTDHAALLPANLKGSAAKKVVDRLLNEKLLQELRAKDDMPIWRRGDDQRPYSLRITKARLRAIEVQGVAEAPDNNAAADPNDVAAPDVSTQAKSGERPGSAKRSGAKKTAAVSARGDTRSAPDNRCLPASSMFRHRLAGTLQAADFSPSSGSIFERKSQNSIVFLGGDRRGTDARPEHRRGDCQCLKAGSWRRHRAGHVERRRIASRSDRRPVALAAEKPRRGQTDHASTSLRRFHRHTGLWFSLASQIFL